MPLFASKRDAGFLKGINRELMHKLISIEVGVYKISLEHTQKNIYEESDDKVYHDPVRIFTMVIPQDRESTGDDNGIDINRQVSFGFMKGDLREKELFLSIGDIVEYDGMFYEVDLVRTDNYWAGRNPVTLIGMQEDNWPAHGYDHSIIVDVHLTKYNTLTTVNTRTGINISNNVSSVPKNIYGE